MNSITYQRSQSLSPESSSRAMRGWVSRETTLISRRKRSAVTLAASCGCSTFSASGSPAAPRARNTARRTAASDLPLDGVLAGERLTDQR